MSKAERIWNWFIGITLTLGDSLVLILYSLTKDYSVKRILFTMFWLLYGTFKIAKMIDYTVNKQ